MLTYTPTPAYLSYRDGSIYFSDHSQGGHPLGPDAGSPQSDTTKDDLSDDAMPVQQHIQTKLEPQDAQNSHTHSHSHSVYADLQKAMPNAHLLPNMGNSGPPPGSGVISVTNGSSQDVGTMLQDYQTLWNY